nr:MAG TPA: dsDNA helicase [Caudoviricetes sp.]
MDQLFSGYVELSGKQCVQKLKDGVYLTKDDAIRLDSYGGVLAPSTILIDIDDEAQSQRFYSMVTGESIECVVVKTTRGRHFYFSGYPTDTRCRTHTRLACGIDADIKVGTRTCYGVLKISGSTRVIERDSMQCDPLPAWACPVSWSPDFEHMAEGDGRNQILFNYILTLQSNGFSRDECRKVLAVVNNYIFDEPMSQSELETVYRDEAFADDIFYLKGQFLFDKFAEYMRSEYDIIKVSNRLHIYDHGVYIADEKRIENAMIQHLPRLSRAKRTETLDYLDVMIGTNSQAADADYVAFRNCIVDLKSWETMPLSPDFVITNQIPWDYDPNAYSAIMDTTLHKLANGDDAVYDLLEEIIGYTFYRRNELRKSFILLGDKANGKSTFLDMIKTLLGEDNISALDLAELNSRFKTAELFGKLANVGDDISDDFIPDVSIFKKLVSGDRVSAERKGKDPFEFNSYAKLLFSANEMPRMRDKTGAVIDRLVIVPFTATFSKDDPDFDPYIKYKLRTPEAMSYLINVGLDGLERVLCNRTFTLSEAAKKELVDYQIMANPISSFFDSLDRDEIIGQTTDSMYDLYIGWTIKSNVSALSAMQFTRQVTKNFCLCTKQVRVDKRKIRVYTQKED